MMSPAKKAAAEPSPGDLLERLERLKEEKGAERDAAQTALSNACDLLGMAEGGPNIAHPGPPRPPADGSPTIPERLRAAKRLEELGREHEPFEAIRAAADELHRTIEASRGTIESKTDAIGTLTDEITQLRAEYRPFFIARNEQGSRAASAAVDGVLAAIDAAKPVVTGTWDGWSEMGIQISRNDELDNARRVVEKIRSECCWPGRTDEAGYRKRQAPPVAQAIRASSAPVAAFAGERT
jgi:hypothetical protein